MANIKNAAVGINSLEDLENNDTVIHALHPGVKIITTFIYLVMVISFNRYALGRLIPYVFYAVVLIALAEIPYGLLLKRLLIALPFSFLAGVSNIFFDRTGAFLFYGFTVTYGMISFVVIILKTLLCVSAVMILIATTSLTDISYQLVRMNIPSIFIMQLTMTYRYITVLLQEAGTMYTAYILRSPKQKGIRMKDMGSFVGQLLLRSIDRAERVYYAMKCRGFNGAFHYSSAKKFSRKDYLYLIIISALMIALRFIDINALIGRIF